MANAPPASAPGGGSTAEKDSSSSAPPAEGKIAELYEYFSYYLAAKIDFVRFSIRRRITIMALVAVAVLVVAGMTVTAGVLICDAISAGLTLLFHSQWLGELVTGVVVLAAVAAAAVLGLRRLITLSHARQRAKYESFRQRQKIRFGHHVAERASQETGHG